MKLFYKSQGAGPDLILLSGHGNTHTAWEHQLPVYTPHFRCVTMDNRGVGKSPIPPRGYAIDDMADDVLELMDDLGMRSAHVAGTSMGASIAMSLALKAPQRVTSLGLHSTLGKPYPHIKLRYSMLIHTVETGDPRLYAEVSAYSAFAEPYVNKNPDLVEAEIERRALRRKTMSDEEVEGMIGQYLAFSTHDPFDRLSSIRAPTLISVGSNDQVTPPKYAEDLHRQIPGSRLVVFEGAPHRAAVFAKDEFNRVSLEFLKGLQIA